MLNIGLIVGSTRPGRFACTPARWIEDGAIERRDFQLETLDLLDAGLPFVDEAIPASLLGGTHSNPAAHAWSRRLGRYDGYIATVAEYNHGPTAALKNAFDNAWSEWRRKPIAFVGYGTTGATRAIGQLHTIVVELQMAPLRHEVTIGMEPFNAVRNNEKSLSDYTHLTHARTAMFDDLVWWANALKRARNRPTLVS